MKRNWFILTVLFFALTARSQTNLVFKAATDNNPGLAQLNGIAYGSDSDFVVVGTNSEVFIGSTSASGLSFATNAVSGMPANKYLISVAYGAGKFVAGDSASDIFVSSNGGTNWTENSAKAFPGGLQVACLAYNSGGTGGFVAASSAPAVISYADTSLTNWNKASVAGGLGGAEALYAATPVGTSGFAVCGLGSAIHISTDLGSSWFTPSGHSYNGSANNLYGIAQGPSGATLVAVGASGTILLSSNGGTNWTSQTSHTASDLNYVAWNGSEFIAVGMNGVILTSPDGSLWTANVSPVGAGDFYAVGCATNGLLQGITVLSGVGSNGLLSIGAALPTFIFTNSFTNICDGHPVTITTTLGGSTGPWEVTWSDGTSNYVASVTNGTATTSITVTNHSADPYTPLLTNYYVAAVTDLVTHYSATTLAGILTNKVYPIPSATVTTITNSICDGSSSVIPVGLTGVGPWTVMWNDGTSNYFTTTNSERIVSPISTDSNTPSTTVYYITNIVATNDNDNLCSDEAPLNGTNTVIAYPIPSATVTTATNSICDGSSNAIPVTLTGVGPWTVIWNDGTSNYFTTNNGTRFVSPPSLDSNTPSTTVYYITNIVTTNDNDNLCSSEALLYGTNTVIAYPIPSATVTTATNSICDGSSNAIPVTLTGVGPWTVIWNDGTSNYFTATNSARIVSPISTDSNTPSTTVYYITNIVATNDNANLCSAVAPLNGTNTVIAYPIPSATVTTATNSICDGSSNAIPVTLTGVGPWTVIWNDGTSNYFTATNSARIVSPISTDSNTPSTTVYYITNIVATNDNANLCSAVAPLNGTNTVIAYPIPSATVTTATNSICDGSSNAIPVTLTGVGPWTVIWNDGTSNYFTATNSARIVSPISTDSNTPSTTVYYITNIVATNDNANLCSAVAPLNGTNTVIAYPIPSATVTTATNSICDGSSNAIPVTLTGVGPWTVIWNDGTSNYFTTNNGTRFVSPPSLDSNTPSTTVYYITNIVTTNDNDNLCSSEALLYGTNTVIAYPIPSATVTTATNSICDGSSNAIPVTLTGVGPWTVIWNDGTSNYFTTNNGTRFVSPISSGPDATSTTVYYITNIVTTNDNANLCSAMAPISGTNTVIAYPLPSSVMTLLGDTNICAGEVATVSATLHGIGPWLVTWSDAGGVPQLVGPAGPGPFTASNTTPVLNNPNLDTATSFSFWVASLETTNGNSCRATSLVGTNTVTVYPLPSASLTTNGTTNICSGETGTISAILHGIGPWLVTWSDAPGAPVMVGPAGSGPYTATHVTPVLNNADTNATTTSNFWLMSLETTSGNNCGATNLAGTNTITVYPLPTATVTLVGASGNLTNLYSGQAVTNQVVLTGVGPWTVTWSDGTTTNASGTNGPVTNYYSVTTNLSTNVAVATNLYYLTSLSSDNACDATNFGGTNTVVVWAPPALYIIDQSTNIVLEWFPPAPINLESGPDLSSNGVWTFITNSTLDQTNYVTNAINTNGPATFYRLNTGTN